MQHSVFKLNTKARDDVCDVFVSFCLFLGCCFFVFNNKYYFESADRKRGVILSSWETRGKKKKFRW